MLKNIIFDLGNVLVEFNPKKFVNENIPVADRDDVFEMIFQRQEWKDLDRGTLSYDEVVHFFGSRYPQYEWKIKKFFDNKIFDCLSEIKGNTEILKDLKAGGYKLYILSNFHYPAFKNISEKWEFLNLFDGMVISSHSNLLKPELEIYKELTNKYSLVPEESIFIDDVQENVEAAEKLGIKGIYLPDYTKLKAELKKEKILN